MMKEPDELEAWEFIKTPAEVLDYKFDFAGLTNQTGTSDYLRSGESIQSRTVTVQSGITKDSDTLSDSNTSVTVWLSGGEQGASYRVDCVAVTNTSPSRTIERYIIVYVQDKKQQHTQN